MKRLGILAVVTLALVAVLGSTALAAKPAASFWARAGHAAQGGSLHVLARVKHADRSQAFSASATVHFASGDVVMDLNRHGKSFTAGGRVPVADDEAVGPVAVDVTITYGVSVQTVPAQGVIQPPD